MNIITVNRVPQIGISTQYNDILMTIEILILKIHSTLSVCQKIDIVQQWVIDTYLIYKTDMGSDRSYPTIHYWTL